MLGICLISCQDTVSSGKAPAVVQTNFEKMYPGENDPDWSVDKNGNYEAHFKKDGERYRADYRPDGTWVETESSIKKSDLPKAVKKVLKYSSYLASIIR